MSVGLPEIITLTALFGGICTLSIGLWHLARDRKQGAGLPAPMETDLANLIREGEERLSSMVAMMDASHQARIETLRQDLTAVKADIDWLTGERMIEQAITMAREGIAVEDISADLGLSMDAAQTISVMRRH